MLITKEKAERIAELSYRLYELNEYQNFISYLKATELDESTGDKLLNQLEKEVAGAKMKDEARSFGADIYHADKEIVLVDNYQYVESISYDESDNKTHRKYDYVDELSCKFVDGEMVDIPKGVEFYAPNVYGPILMVNKDGGRYPEIRSLLNRTLFLKMVIAEDRRINPYSLSVTGPYGKNYNKYMFPMEEAVSKTFGYDEEVDLLNNMLGVLDGKFFSQRDVGGFADIAIKPTVLYLESLGEVELADRFRKYQRQPTYLNLVLDMAKKGYYGITFSGENNRLNLL